MAKRQKYTPSAQYTVIMTMTHYKTKKQRQVNRVFGPFDSRSGATAFINAIRKDIRSTIEEEYLKAPDKDEPLRYDNVEYSFATAELWVKDLLAS